MTSPGIRPTGTTDGPGVTEPVGSGVWLVRAFWDRIQARDWARVAELLAPEVVLDWPVSRERVVGAANLVAVNAEYPEGWAIRVLRVIGHGPDVASEVDVTMPDAPASRSAAFWTVADGRITSGVEYWSTVGADPAPPWRAPYTTRLD